MENKICENCGKEHDGSYATGRFCSKKCARSFSTKNDTKGIKKISSCEGCGKNFEIGKRASIKKIHFCDVCKQEKEIEKNRYCKSCGQEKELCEKSRPDICKKYKSFPVMIKKMGFDERKIGTIGVYEEFERIKNILIEDYWDNKMSCSDINKKYSAYITDIMYVFNIQKRSVSQSVSNAYDQGKLDKFKLAKNSADNPKINYHLHYVQGWHTTWTGTQVFYRSSYELEYCKELDEKKIEYTMEKIRIFYWDSQLLKQRLAIPDFYIPGENLIVEVKAYYHHDPINIRDRVKSYREHGYNFKYILEHEEVIIE